MEPIKVEVTQADIDAGEPCCAGTCPIARAMTRALGRPIAVCSRFWSYADEQNTAYCMPPSASAFVRDFDDGHIEAMREIRGLSTPKPFSFELEIVEYVHPSLRIP